MRRTAKERIVFTAYNFGRHNVREQKDEND